MDERAAPALIAPAEPRDEATLTRIMQECGLSFEFRKELNRPYARIWVARPHAEGEAQGVLVAWQVADEAHLIDLAVDPAFRRRGVARALLRHLISSSLRQGLRLIALEVRSGNDPAIRLYRAFEFEEVGERRGYYADGEDARLFSLRLLP
ncbi:MAG TPA: GNAT family N-acetyltransferase [Polyangiaceae bacterium]|nr:GNAT family N-acetyltransferase [Polyangiaceae bacterium]